MKSLYLDLAWKTLLSVAAVVSVAVVAIHDRLEAAPSDKVYPILLILAIAYLHWIAWELFFGFFGVPTLAQKKIRADSIRMRSTSGFIIAVGYVFTLISIFNHVISPEYAHAAEMISWAIKLIAAGVLIQMIFGIRELLSDKLKNEKIA
jgi:hypothetical protein